jgi:hypothetical protein
MSQNTDPQNRLTDPQLKPSDTNWPAARLLDVAVIIYLGALAAFIALAALGIHTEANKRGATVLLVVPAVLPGATFVVFYLLFFVSSLASVPLINFSSGLSAMQRNFRGIVVTVLLLAVLCAVLAAAAT